MITARNLADLESAKKSLNAKILGLVPTMGALHEGHATLIRKAAAECDAVVVSDFVNPTQFNNQDDFRTYPRTLESDGVFAASAGADILFAPGVEDMYPEGSGIDRKVFDLGGIDRYGEGPRRPGHFNGMAQIVTRLFDTVKPDKAYFGEKDYQQLAIIEYFTKNLRYPVEIVRCPIARAADGLALSSRNSLLTAGQRAAAPGIFKAISRAVEYVGKMSVDDAAAAVREEIDGNSFLRTEYVEIADEATMRPVSSWDEAQGIRLFCAVYDGNVRLIDNMKLK